MPSRRLGGLSLGNGDMTSVFFIFFIEPFAFRWGTTRTQRLNGDKVAYDAHGHAYGPQGIHAAHGPEGEMLSASPAPAGLKAGGIGEHKVDVSHSNPHSIEDHNRRHNHNHNHNHDEGTGPLDNHPLAQILSTAILEYGVIFHSFIVGITLAISVDLIPLSLVLIFHQLFEGLGLGTRLAHLAIFTSPRIEVQARAQALEEDNSSSSTSNAKAKGLPFSPLRLSKGYALFPWFGALAFALTLPLGVAVRLGMRSSYDPYNATANIVSGLFDAFSSGILLYAGLVELLAH